MRVEANRTPNPKKWNPVAFHFFVHSPYGDTEQISQFFDPEGLILRTQPFGKGHDLSSRRSGVKRHEGERVHWLFGDQVVGSGFFDQSSAQESHTTPLHVVSPASRGLSSRSKHRAP